MDTQHYEEPDDLGIVLVDGENCEQWETVMVAIWKWFQARGLREQRDWLETLDRWVEEEAVVLHDGEPFLVQEEHEEDEDGCWTTRWWRTPLVDALLACDTDARQWTEDECIVLSRLGVI